MVSIQNLQAVGERLLAPVRDYLESARHRFACSKLSDESWLTIGVLRVLEDEVSGSAFLQKLLLSFDADLRKGHYFESLKSRRRLGHLQDLVKHFTNDLAQQVLQENPSAGLCEELADFHLYCGDGHFHAAASHDERGAKDAKQAIGHLYSLNLRNRLLSHLGLSSVATKKKAHDMGTLKRTEIEILRQGALKGQKVLYIWDRAGIDFQQWYKWKHGSGIYFLSREKENMALEVIAKHGFDREDPRNAGVLADEAVTTSQGVSVRRVSYRIPETGEEMSFLTNLGPAIAPGVVAQLYFMRWNIEKSFDVLKNKLFERKAWATSDTAKRMQAQFIVLGYNLAHLLHEEIEREHGRLPDNPSTRKRIQRLKKLKEDLAKQGLSLSSLRSQAQRASQLGVKFYRWLRHALHEATCWQRSIAKLQILYAQL